MKQIIKVLLIVTVLTSSTGCLQTIRDAYDRYRNQIEKPESPDAIDLSKITWIHADVSGWEITSDLRSVTWSGSMITLDHSMAGKWPRGKYNSDGPWVEANPWIFVQQSDGTWLASTWEWMRPGQITKSASAVTGAKMSGPLRNFQPVSGTEYGWMISGMARSPARNVHERTQIILVRYP